MCMARLAVTEKLAADSSPQSLPSLSSFEANGGKLPKQLKLGFTVWIFAIWAHHRALA